MTSQVLNPLNLLATRVLVQGAECIACQCWGTVGASRITNTWSQIHDICIYIYIYREREGERASYSKIHRKGLYVMLIGALYASSGGNSGGASRVCAQLELWEDLASGEVFRNPM